MNTYESEIIVHRTVLFVGNCFKFIPDVGNCIRIMYRKFEHIAAITVEAESHSSKMLHFGQSQDKFLNLAITQSPENIVHFKVEIEDLSKNVVFSFVGQWQNNVIKKICNVSELIRQNPNLCDETPMTLALSISLGSLHQLNERKCEKPLNPDVALLQTLKTMLNNGCLTDVVIKTEEEEFQCHKLVLAASSEKFRVMFDAETNERKQNVVDFTGVYDGATIRDLLQFLYTNETPPNIGNTVLSLLAASEFFQLPNLKSVCLNSLCRVINVETAAEALQLAVKYNSEVLKMRAVNFIVENRQKVMDTPGWNNIPDDMAKALLSTFLLNVNAESK